jgi:hypothetical protein
MKLSDVKFPVYVVHTDEVINRDGILWCEGAVVDDKNVKGSTIGERRLKTPMKNLYSLRHMLENFIDMSKHRGKFYVDSDGKFFVYEKSITAKLKYHKIKKIVPKGVASLLYLHGVDNPFEIKRLPSNFEQYAGVLYIRNIPSYLYELTTDKKKDTWRKV